MYSYYTVLAGDTLTSIANKYGTTVNELRELNKFSDDYQLKTGERILVPTPGINLFNYYKVLKGDTLYQIAKNANASVEMLAKLNGLDINDPIYEGDIIIVPKEGTVLYITSLGDTLKNVGTKLGVKEEVLTEQNPSIYLVEDQLLVYKK